MHKGDNKAADCLCAESEFRNKHFAAWVLTFCDKVVKDAELTFYKEMVALTVCFVQSEEVVEQLIRPLPLTERRWQVFASITPVFQLISINRMP